MHAAFMFVEYRLKLFLQFSFDNRYDRNCTETLTVCLEKFERQDKSHYDLPIASQNNIIYSFLTFQ